MGMMWSTQVRLQKLRRHGRPFDEYATVRFGDDGGLFQNNHHKYQSRASFTLRRHEVDPTYPVIRLLQNLGIVRLSREIAWLSTPQKAPQSAFPEDNRRRTHPPKKTLDSRNSPSYLKTCKSFITCKTGNWHEEYLLNCGPRETA
jgi:hypothetical protein